MEVIQFYNDENRGRVFDSHGQMVSEIIMDHSKKGLGDFLDTIWSIGLSVKNWKKTDFGFEGELLTPKADNDE